MKEIKLTQGKVALVDDEDFERVSNYKWWASKDVDNFYAVGWVGGKRTKMHRFILGENNGAVLIDHRDRNGLNNQRGNLRNCSKSQNNCNRKSKAGSSSKYLGLSFDKLTNKFRVRIRKNKCMIELGRYENEEVEAIIYNKAASELHGEFANLNKIAI